MPTAHEYREAARRLRRLSGQLSLDVLTIRTAHDVERVASGPVRMILENALDALDVATTRATDELDRLAGVCERRAEVCAEYAGDVWRHRLLSGGAPWVPPPPRPAWWADA